MKRPNGRVPLALRVAVLLLPDDVRDEVLGDLVEAWRARGRNHSALSRFVWTWKQPLAVLRSRAWDARRSPERSALLGELRSDVRIALRSLLRVPTFTTVVVMTIAVAMGANTTIFAVVDAVLLDPLPFPESDRLVTIAASAPGTGMPDEFGPAPEFYLQYREEADLLEDLGMFVVGQFTMRTQERSEHIFMLQGVPSLFSTLGASPVLGRLPRPEDAMGATVLISHSLWTSWFGADPAVIGSSYEIAGTSRTVIGVMGPEFRFPDERVSVWIHATVGEFDDIRPGSFGFSFVGRMAPGADRDRLAEQLDALARRLPERVGGSPGYARIIERHEAVVRSLEDDLVGDASGPLRALWITVGIVLLIACANAGNLMMVRGESRRRELSVRRVLGAGRWGLIRIQMTETGVLAVLGASGGWLLAWAALPALVRAAPENIPNLGSARLDSSSLLFTAGLALVTACTVGFIPAIRLSKEGHVGDLSSFDGVRGRHHRSTHSALVTIQTGSALMLLIASGLLMRSYWTLSEVDSGYDTRDIFTFQMAPDRGRFSDGPSYARFHRRFMDRLAALPGVESVGLTRALPLDEGAGSTRLSTERMHASGETPLHARYTIIGGAYFETMGIGLLEGRLLEPGDHEGTGNVVISRFTAEMLWQGEDPLGKPVRTSLDSTNWKEVVGVVEDILVDDLREAESVPMIYLPMVGPTPDSWSAASPVYVLRSGRAGALATEVRELVRQVVPEAPVYRVFTMEALADRSKATLSFTMVLLVIASGLALFLGAVGLYGVLSYVVSQRAPEIAVRVAVGAESAQVQRMIVRQGARLSLIGVLVGLMGSLAGARALDSLLFGVGPWDPATFITMSCVMFAVALSASYLPAARASRTDPMRLLRTD